MSKCPKCNKEQLYTRKDNGILICNYCKEPLPLPDKIPETPYIPMDKNGHSRSMK